MNIGLVRHFKVNLKPGDGILSPAQFASAMSDYDSAPVTPNDLKINNADWEICCSSTLPRAVKTAKTIYNGEIILTDLLKEVPILPFTKKNIKLPSFVWHIGARVAWYRNKTSQPEVRLQTIERVNKVIEMVLSTKYEKVLIVSHGFFMGSLFRELLNRGFKGEMDIGPKNGKLYTLEN